MVSKAIALKNRIISFYKKIPPAFRLLFWLVVIIKYLVVAGFILYPIFAGQGEQSQKIAVPDWKVLRERHPAWKSTKALTEEIGRLDKEIASEKFQKEQKIANTLASLSNSIKKSRKETSSSEVENKLMEKRLKYSIKTLVTVDFDTMLSTVDNRFKKQVEMQRLELENSFKSFAAQMMEEREKRIQSKKEALEDEVSEVIRAKEQLLKREYLEYQGKILKQNQNEKLNLQLQLIVTKTAEERSKLETRLGYLMGDEELIMRAKLEEDAASINALKKEQETRIADELKRFQDDLSKETKISLDKRKKELRDAFADFLKSNTSVSGAKINALKGYLFKEAVPSLPAQEKSLPKGKKSKSSIEFYKTAERFSILKAKVDNRLKEEQDALSKRSQELIKKAKADWEERLKLLKGQRQTLVDQYNRLVKEIDRDIEDRINRGS